MIKNEFLLDDCANFVLHARLRAVFDCHRAVEYREGLVGLTVADNRIVGLELSLLFDFLNHSERLFQIHFLAEEDVVADDQNLKWKLIKSKIENNKI